MPKELSQEVLQNAYKDLHIAAQALVDKMRLEPGGDKFVFTGSINLVEHLRMELDLIEQDSRFFEIVYPEDDLDA